MSAHCQDISSERSAQWTSWDSVFFIAVEEMQLSPATPGKSRNTMVKKAPII